MPPPVAQIALVGVVIFAFFAILGIIIGEYLFAGISFLIVSFLLYVRETRKE